MCIVFLINVYKDLVNIVQNLQLIKTEDRGHQLLEGAKFCFLAYLTKLLLNFSKTFFNITNFSRKLPSGDW
jgi:hypothetical protein